jgi:hypothetical protein
VRARAINSSGESFASAECVADPRSGVIPRIIAIMRIAWLLLIFQTSHVAVAPLYAAG